LLLLQQHVLPMLIQAQNLMMDRTSCAIKVDCEIAVPENKGE
jgi:hypothetical protein